MKTLLNSSFCDNAILLTFILALLSTFILKMKSFIRKKEYENIFKNIENKYAITWIILIPCIIMLSVYLYIKSNKYFTTIFGIFLIISVIYYIDKNFKLINKKEFYKINFSIDDKYNIILSQFIYFIFFMQPIYSLTINSIDNITDKFICDSILLFYMTLKSIILMYYLIINILLTAKNLYKTFGPNSYHKLLIFKNSIKSFEMELILNKKNIVLIFSKTNLPNILSAIIKCIENSCSKDFFNFYFKTPIIILIFYIVNFFKMILMLVVNILVFLLATLKEKLRNEIVFFYKLLYLCIFISISLIFIHILNHNIFDNNSIKLFEFFGITIFISIARQQLKEMTQYFEKEH